MAAPLPQPDDIHESSGSLPPDIDSLQAAPRAKPVRAPLTKSIQPSAEPTPVRAAVPPEQIAHAKKTVLLFGGGLYALYVLWSLGLMMILPSPTGDLKELIGIGVMTSIAGAVALILAGLMLLQRIMRADVPVVNRQRSLIKLVAAMVPGLILSAIVPFMIIREPGLTLQIVQPTRAEDLVAPVAVTVSAEGAADVLRNLGFKPVQYIWDTDGDGQENDRTVEPSITVLFERQGTYTVIARVVLDNGDSRRVGRRIYIPQAVFRITPTQPIVEKPVQFSVAHLFPDPKVLKEIQWDLDGDGQIDETTTSLDVLHTYYRTGRVTVSAVILRQDNTQVTYKRSIDVTVPPPLPFPVTLNTEPKMLIGPAPFGAIFRIETDVPLNDIHWMYGDGKEDRGADMKRVSHLFDTPGVYPVVTRIRNETGALAEITTLVKVTETLSLPDLQFTGAPQVTNNNTTIKGEVPLKIQLTPKTTLPLVEFQWEAEEGLGAKINGATIDVTVRREGIYTLTLIAQDPEGKAVRMPIRVEVSSTSPEPAIIARPEGGVAPLTVTFDASETFIPDGQEIAGFKWLFGDEGGKRDPEVGASRVQHTYQLPGSYVVRMSVVMANGKEFTAERTIIIRQPQVSACIIPSRTRVEVGKGIEFDSSCSSGSPTSYLWDVRYDAQPDTPLAQSPESKYVYVFQTPGTYTVNLTIRDRFGNQDKKSVAITVDPPAEP
jgi:PKD repeat protein